MKNKYSKALILIVAFLILTLTTIASYAYFTASVAGNTTASNTIIQTGTMQLLLTDGEQVSLENAIPGTSVTKSFKVKNTGTVQTNYDVYLSEIINTFADKNDLVYTLTSANGCPNATETVVPSKTGEQSKIVSSCSINPNQEHEYVLTVLFKDDNTNQDDNKGKKFSAKISVNEYKEVKTIVQEILDLKELGSADLEYDETVDNNLRYIGSSPNNYVRFNNELWRIIGVMNNIETSSGQTQSLLKIRKAEPLGNYSWDTSVSSINEGYGINQWGASDGYEGADLMRELNTDYLGNITIGIDGKWYNYENNVKTKDMPTSTINQSSQDMIETVIWNLGSPSNNNGTYDSSWDTNITPSTSYTRERAATNGKVCTSEEYCDDTVTRTSTWTGKVALIYPSDYGYSTSGGNTTNRATCLSASMFSWNDSGVSDCKANSWIYNSTLNQWTLSPGAHSSRAFNVFIVNSNGLVYGSDAGSAYAASPVVFLKSSIAITGGTGTESDPYTLG